MAPAVTGLGSGAAGCPAGEAEAMEAFVLAHKTGRPVDAIAAWFGEGLTEHVMLERIYEEVYA